MSEDADFYRPTRREWFNGQSQGRSQFGLHLNLNGHRYLMPLSFILIERGERVWRADREESIAILLNEEKWSTGVPIWAQNIPLNLSDEDLKLLSGMKIAVQ